MLREHTEKKADRWSVGSKEKLKASIRHKLKRVFVGCLDVIEKELRVGMPDNDDNEEKFRRMRNKILGVGNDQIRNMELELEERYNIEFIPYEIRLEPLRGEGNGQGQDI